MIAKATAMPEPIHDGTPYQPDNCQISAAATDPTIPIITVTTQFMLSLSGSISLAITPISAPSNTCQNQTILLLAQSWALMAALFIFYPVSCFTCLQRTYIPTLRNARKRPCFRSVSPLTPYCPGDHFTGNS